MMPTMACTRLAARLSRSGLMMGIPPATLPSKNRSTPRRAAKERSSGPCLASTSLLAVTTGLPLSSAAAMRSRAGSTPPMTSTTMSMPGSLTISHGSVVSSAGSRDTVLLFLGSRTATRRTSMGAPARAAMRSPLACKIESTPLPTVPHPSRPTCTGFSTGASSRGACNFQDYNMFPKVNKERHRPLATRRRNGCRCRARRWPRPGGLLGHRILQSLPSLERRNLAGRDLDVGTRLRIAPPPGRPLPHFKGAETDDLNPLAAGQRLGDRFEQRVHRLAGVLLGQAALGGHPIDQFRFGQARHLP